MTSVGFGNNYINVQLNNAVKSVSLFDTKDEGLPNGQFTTNAVSGKSLKAKVTYKGNNPPPRTFKVTKEITFPDDTQITLTGGGVNDTFIEAVDLDNNRAVWSI